MNAIGILREAKCPTHGDLLNQKKLYIPEFFSDLQDVQKAVNDAVNKIRTALKEDEGVVLVAVDKYHHTKDSRLLARKVLEKHGWRFLESPQKENRQFEYWSIDLSEQPQCD